MLADYRRRGVVVLTPGEVAAALAESGAPVSADLVRELDASILYPVQRDPLPPIEPRTLADLLAAHERCSFFPADAHLTQLLPRGAKRLHGAPKQIKGTKGRVRYRKRVRVDGRKLSRVTR
jgi:hypothetical protein